MKKGACCAAMLVCVLASVCAWGATQTVNLPVTLDYPMLRALLINQVYTGPGERAEVAKEGCSDVELWAPQVSSDGPLLKVGSTFRVRAGFAVGEGCFHYGQREGFVELFEAVRLDEKDWHLKLTLVNSKIYNSKHKETFVSRFFRDVVVSQFQQFLGRLNVDLGPPVQGIRGFLPLLFSPGDRENVERWLGTIRPGRIRVEPDGLRTEIIMQVDIVEAPPPGAPPPSEAAEKLSSAEIDRLTSNWQTWDAFFVYMVETLVGDPLTNEERARLLETLLEIRYTFSKALSEGTLTTHLVREQFRESWESVSNIMRKYLTSQPSPKLMTYIAYFTAADAMTALDRLGPSLGMEISRDGLIRLARMLGGEETGPPLEYSYAIDPRLRELVGLGPPLEETGPAFDVDELDLPQDQGTDPVETSPPAVGKESWLRFFIASAYAAGAPLAAPPEVTGWIPTGQNIGGFLERVRGVLEQSAAKTAAKDGLDTAYHPFFRLLTFATGWQESCWRPFIKRRGKVHYLISYNGTSVGLMQVNQRVWRGMYKPQSLRWDVRYNASAGTEILSLYLRDYVLKTELASDQDAVARGVYAMYNGGPGELKRFLLRRQRNTYTPTDKSFHEKYGFIKEGRFDGISVCILGGGGSQ